MNSFFVPQLGSQIYTMAGMTTQLNLRADDPVDYPGISAQFSGEGFSDMRFEMEAVPTEEYEAWVRSVRAGGGLLNSQRYEQLVIPSINDAETTFGTVEARLFDAIVEGRGGPPRFATEPETYIGMSTPSKIAQTPIGDP
jgi:cytochrome o ubiquinol oxidase subunit 2